MSGFRPIERPAPWALQFQNTDEPVSGLHGRWHADQLAFLLAQCLPNIASIYPKRYAHASNDSVVKFPYYRSPGARALLVGCEVFGAGNAEVTFAGGTLIDAGAPPLDGSEALQGFPPLAAISPVYATFDASSFSGTPDTITCTRHPVASTYGSETSGFRRVFALEIPRALIDPVTNPTTDVSFNYSWPIPPGKLVDGTSSTSRGFTRLVAQLIKARTQVRHHRTLATLEDTTNAWQTNSTSFVPLIATGCEWYARARRVYDAATNNPQILYVRYQADKAWVLRIKTTVNGTPTNNDFSFSSSVGAFTFNSGSTLNLSPAHNTAGEEQRVKIEYEYRIPTGNGTTDKVYVSCVSLIENET